MVDSALWMGLTSGLPAASEDEQLVAAVSAVPSGAWAVGVSGGADSVALLLLLARRNDLQLHVAHLDHELRGAESRQDAIFVATLCQRLAIACTVAERRQIEPRIGSLPGNPSARYRSARLALFAKIVAEHHLNGVLLAHHATDQAETILQRLLRGPGYVGLSGMAAESRIGGLRVGRPLLGIAPGILRSWLIGRGQDWREDASNESDRYQRNRLRRILSDRPELIAPLLRLGRSARFVRDWATGAAPRLATQFIASDLADLPDALARESARAWLVAAAEAHVPAIDGRSIRRLVEMTRDAASPARADFPGGVQVARRRGVIFAGPARQRSLPR